MNWLKRLFSALTAPAKPKAPAKPSYMFLELLSGIQDSKRRTAIYFSNDAAAIAKARAEALREQQSGEAAEGSTAEVDGKIYVKQNGKWNLQEAK